MEPISIPAKEVLEDDKVTSIKFNNFVGMEDDNHVSVSASELQMEFEKVISELSSIVDIRRPNSWRCTGESCRCGNKLTSMESIGLAGPIQNLAWSCIASTDNRALESLGMLSITSSLINIAWTLKTSEILFDMCQRTKSINRLGDFVFDGCAISSPGNSIISPSARWILDSLEGNFIGGAFRKSSMLFNFDARDNARRNVKSRTVSITQTKSPEFANYLPEHYDTALQNPKFDMVPFEKRRLKSFIAEEMLLSCSSSTTSCSNQTTSSAHHCVSMGLLRCARKSGTPYFEFSLDDDLGEVYVADAQKIDSSLDKALDYIYLFLSRTAVKKHPRNQNSKDLDIVGKMKVTSSLVLSSNRCKYIETEFVLLGADDDHSSKMQVSTSTSTKSKGLSQKISDIFRSKHFAKPKSGYKISEPIFENFLSEEFASDLNDIEPGVMDHLAHDFPPNLELTSIIVKDNRPIRKEEVACGGWGLKFLEKAEVSYSDTSTDPSASKVCEESCIKDSTVFSRDINVLVPAGFHGSPVTRNGGPSGLIERWRSGGHCDCGGWDIGCPITVLNNNSEASLHIESQDGCESVSFYTEGADHDDPIFRMVQIDENLYHIYFQASLSALQSFSIGVAIIHTQTPDLYPKL